MVTSKTESESKIEIANRGFRPATNSAIPSWALRLVNQSDCDQIEAAVRQAEMSTAGEIVPMLVHSSVRSNAPRRILFFMLLTFIAIGLGLFATDYYSWTSIAAEIGLGCVAAGIAFFAPIPPVILRQLLPKFDLHQSVEQRAELEFYRCGINGTSRHAGVLLFVSLAERRAVVLADQAIASKVVSHTWDQVLSTLLDGIKVGATGKGFVDAIGQSAKILAELFPNGKNDSNELDNRLIIKD